MVRIDSTECTGCGSCVDACPEQAISLSSGLAVINQGLCIECGSCVASCPVGAIHESVPVYSRLQRGGDSMPYGFGRGLGWRGRGRGNPYPFCRFYPWLPRRWWAARPGSYLNVTPAYHRAYRPFAWW